MLRSTCALCKRVKTTIITHKLKNSTAMKRTKTNAYSAPLLIVEELQIEQGFALSDQYGNEGEAGQSSGYIDNDCEL